MPSKEKETASRLTWEFRHFRPRTYLLSHLSPLSASWTSRSEVNETSVQITACSTGNPHCSLFVDRIDSEMVNTLGPRLEIHPAFPNGTNVEFIHVRNSSEIEVAFWERGAGRTPSSGTGFLRRNGRIGTQPAHRTCCDGSHRTWDARGRVERRQ